MITINKGEEPVEWTDYRNTEGVAYTAIPELREALLRDQGYICAYCMRRIPVAKRDPNELETSKIEHVLSRRHYTERELDYDNMVICCPGNINGTSHCDKSKESTEISLSPLNIHVQQSISYSTYKGDIKSNNETWNTEINKILCLNNPMLKYNRNQAWAGIHAILEKQKWKKARIEEKLEEWTNFDNEGKLNPYSGIVIWYLQKKLRQI